MAYAKYPWETLNIYSQQHDRWFEPLSRHLPGPEHLAVYRALIPHDWRTRERGLWIIADPPEVKLPGQGWKLHVSVRTGHGAEALRASIPVLLKHQTHFKFLVDPWSLALTNGKLWPRASGGKFITVYPADEVEFCAVARELTAALADFTGPYILGDRRAPGSTAVYYRYGGFTGQPRLRPDGVSDLMITAPDGSLHPDIRHPYWSAASWLVTDPFGLDAQREVATENAGDGLAGGRFTIQSAITFTNRGGVYRGVDATTGQSVVVKEARPHVGLGAGRGSNIDVTDLLAKEHRILTTLAEVEQFVDPVALFHEWEHSFLVEKFVDGRHLGQISISSNPLYANQLTGAAFAAYHGRMRGLFAQVAAAIAAAHRHGIVLADLSFTNIMVDGDDRIRLIDLEGAIEEGVDPTPGLYTPGVSGPRVPGAEPTAADDYAALGAMMFGSVVLSNAVVGFHPPARERFLAELKSDLALPADLIALISDLTSGAPPDGKVVGKRIAELCVADPAAWPEVLPFGRPATEQVVGERAGRLRTRIEETVAGVTRYIRATASPLRDDRLFPADLGVFETNPFSVALGAAGVLRALHRLPGDVPPALRSWILRRDLSGRDLPPGLYHGTAGIAWALDELGEREAAVALMRRTAGHPLLLGQADVMNGCAGYGLAALRFWHRTGEQSFLDEAIRIGTHLAAGADRDETGVSWRNPEGKIPIGYGYGASGIALFLLYLHHATGDAETLRLGRQALDFDLARAVTTDYGMTSFLADAQDKSAVLRSYWDFGTAGILTTLVRYLDTTGDEALAAWLDRLLPDITRKYAVLPQMFHGLAGMGNVLLDVAEFTGRDHLYADAQRLAEGVLLFAIDRSEGIAFPGEQAVRETCDFATGSAGVALFLDRVLRSGPGSRTTNFNFVVDELLPGRRDGR